MYAKQKNYFRKQQRKSININQCVLKEHSNGQAKET